jgi:SAM-dependent methyltransferase
MIADPDTWDRWNLDRATEGLSPERQRLTDVAVDEVRGLVPFGGRVLDIGVGAGFTSRALQVAYDYRGLDIGEQSIAEAKRRAPMANLEVADFLEWRLPGRSFDGVLCVDTIAYFGDQGLGVWKLFAALRPGGVLVLTTVNPFVFSRFAWVQARGERMGRWFTRRRLHTLLGLYGFKVERSYTVAPAGDQGWLRLLNGRRLVRLLGRPYQRFLEWLGLGQFRVVVARRPL